ncbi:hypothetical protein RFI_10378 [Reticulomyxa filosa]|uniref:Uncharacterized protein n=1 Tax=Reticulomyxa filosa TaxID=46433 RepID=X6NL87_RETFI|nr:hypothetical protein RFI_10378 [Reticulomyxa filosa]|eukprot:ETO26756.1 hypothetical protein RFI_10378 [Reticulomyxa filosa]
MADFTLLDDSTNPLKRSKKEEKLKKKVSEFLVYVVAAQKLGFSKVTIIDRSTYTPVGYTATTDIATAWMDGETQVNENQELLEWGQKDGKPKTTFCFYGKRFNILQRLEDGKAIVCLKGKDIFIGYQFKAVWFLAYGEVASRSVDKSNQEQAAGFKSAPDAFSSIMKNVFESLDEAGL